MKVRCLYCYQPIDAGQGEYHSACSKKIFGIPLPPELPYSEENMRDLAREIIQSQTTVTGVQPKLSMHLEAPSQNNRVKKFTIVGMWGGYILKPPSQDYPQLPEIEDLTMHLAEIANIKTVPHSLIRLQSGNLAYITKRIDRIGESKIAMEDMCQLTERLTEDKYLGSYEQIAKAIFQYSATPGLDVVNFYEQVLFSFLTGNADMHLKNFSLIYQAELGYVLSPAYDMVATALVNPSDDEDLALHLNGKKKKIKYADFNRAFINIGLDDKQQHNIFMKMKKAFPKWEEMINNSFLSQDFKAAYQRLIKENMSRLMLL